MFCRFPPVIKTTLALTVIITCLLSLAYVSHANEVTTAQTALKGASSTKEITAISGHIAAIPLSAANILRLPLGIVQVTTAPLPGITVVDGLTNLGKGMIAPFDFLINTLALPSRTVSSVGRLPPRILHK